MTEKDRHLNKISDKKMKVGSLPPGVSIDISFLNYLSNIFIGSDSSALSVSTGDAYRDYLVFSNTGGDVKKIIATDIVDNPVDKEDQELLKSLGDWEFQKVEAEKPLPFSDEQFDLVYHLDVVEHVKKPYLFLSEQYRVLKEGGTLIVGTPNIFRPTNIFKLLLGKLHFPLKIGHNEEIGDYIHIQEFNEFQLRNLLEEVGFKDIEIKHCYFGIWPLRITINLFPKSKLGKGMCHYLMFRCSK